MSWLSLPVPSNLPDVPLVKVVGKWGGDCNATPPPSLPSQNSVASPARRKVSFGAVGNGSHSSSGELISVPRVCTFPFQEGLAQSPEGHG